jgi:hypothetical protein
MQPCAETNAVSACQPLPVNRYDREDMSRRSRHQYLGETPVGQGSLARPDALAGVTVGQACAALVVGCVWAEATRAGRARRHTPWTGSWTKGKVRTPTVRACPQRVPPDMGGCGALTVPARQDGSGSAGDTPHRRTSTVHMQPSTEESIEFIQGDQESRVDRPPAHRATPPSRCWLRCTQRSKVPKN